jgi:asparagine synthase (glutamine-hydrolysing)
MCGIGGAVALRDDARPDRERVRALSAAIVHRGPDGEGLYESPDGRALLAHRRLSIIDLATGQQPMCSPDGRLVTVFNGEIYNYRELRDALLRDGAAFRTQSDTEVLLHRFARDGESCLHALRGMFAFALWDAARRRLVLARDRLGKKPLYYVVEDGCLYFASALNALRQSTSHPWTVDERALEAYLALGYIPAPRTIYREVRKLEAGTYLVVQDGKMREARYWDLSDDPAPFSGGFDDAVERLDDLLRTAVSIRLRSDVPLGVFLSGGIDSSLVTAIACRVGEGEIRTFSIGFDHDDFDESPFAARVAAHLGTRHRAFRVQPDVLGLLPSLVAHYGEPFADSSAIPTWILAQHTRREVTVALGGDGGDEGFAGYLWYRTAARLETFARLLPAPVNAAMAVAAGGGERGGPRLARVGRALAMTARRPAAARFAALRSFVNDAEARLLYAPPLLEARADQRTAPVPQLERLYARCQGTALRRMRYVDIRTYLADCLLTKVDVATMAHGLEARAPLLDHEVITFALSLRDEHLMDGWGGKRPLRALLARYVPRALFERRKQGFTLPLAPWFAGPLRSRLDAMASSPALRDSGWLRPEGITRLIEQHARGERDNSQRLFSLLMLDEWLRRQ